MKILKYLTILGLSSLLFTCGLAQSRTLRIGTEPTYAPFEFSEQGKLTGFDIEFMEALAKVGGFEVEWVPSRFDGIIPSLLTNALDLGISGFVKNEERAKRVLFSDPYYVAGQSIMIHKDDVDAIKGLSDLEGKDVCVQIGTVGAKLAQEKIKDVKLITFDAMPEAYMELDKKGCVAAITGNPVADYYLATNRGPNLVRLKELIGGDDVAIIAAKDNQELIDLINQSFAKLKADGTYDKLYNKWFAASAQ